MPIKLFGQEMSNDYKYSINAIITYQNIELGKSHLSDANESMINCDEHLNGMNSSDEEMISSDNLKYIFELKKMEDIFYIEQLLDKQCSKVIIPYESSLPGGEITDTSENVKCKNIITPLNEWELITKDDIFYSENSVRRIDIVDIIRKRSSDLPVLEKLHKFTFRLIRSNRIMVSV